MRWADCMIEESLAATLTLLLSTAFWSDAFHVWTVSGLFCVITEMSEAHLHSQNKITTVPDAVRFSDRY